MFYLCGEIWNLITTQNIHRIIEKEKSLFGDMIITIIVRKKVRNNTCPGLIGHWEIDVGIYKQKIIMYGNKTYNFLTVNFYLKFNLMFKLLMFLHRHNTFPIFHNKCSKIPSSTSTHFATQIRQSCISLERWSWRSFMLAATFKMRASNLCSVSSFTL